MNLSWKHVYSYSPAIRNITPKIRNDTIRLKSFKAYSKHRLSESNSNKTLIDNRSISQSFNSSVLTMKLKTYKYKRAETELRKILKKPVSPQLSIKANRLTSFLSRSARLVKFPILQKTDAYNKKHDSSLSPGEANLIIDEYRKIHKPEL